MTKYMYINIVNKSVPNNLKAVEHLQGSQMGWDQVSGGVHKSVHKILQAVAIVTN